MWDPWRVYWSDEVWYSNAEFAAAFVPAERLDALIEAARAWVEQRRMCHDPMTYRGAIKELARREHLLAAALRAYDEGQEQ